MFRAVIHAPGDIRYEDRADPKIEQWTDAIIRVSATCVCGSDLWDYRGIDPVTGPTPMRHAYAGIVEDIGPDVTMIKPGQFVIDLRSQIREARSRLTGAGQAPSCVPS